MAGLSFSSQTAALNHIFRQTEGGAALPTPTQLFLSVHTGDPLDDDSGNNEVVGGSYARITLNDLGNDWTAASARQIANANELLIADMPAVTVTHIGIYSALSGGSLIFSYALTTPRVVEATNTLRISAGVFTITVTTPYWTDYLANSYLNHQFRGVAMTRPVQQVQSLWNGDPTSVGIEFSGGGYARQNVGFGTPLADGPNNTYSVSNADVTNFTNLSANTLTDWGLHDHLGTLIAYHTQTSSAISDGGSAEYPIGTAKVGVD